MTVCVRTNNGKTISIKCDRRQIFRYSRMKWKKNKDPRTLLHLSNQGKPPPDQLKKEIREESTVMETLLQKFQTNTMEKMQLMTKQTNETMLQSVGSQLQGMITTIEKVKVENEELQKYGRKITIMEQRMAMLEDRYRRRSDTKANDMEGNNSQEDQNQRRAVVIGVHDDTTTQEVQDTLKEIIMTIGMSMEQIQIKCPTKLVTYAFLQFKDNDERETTLSDQETC